MCVGPCRPVACCVAFVRAGLLVSLLSWLPLEAADLSGKCAKINSLIATEFAKHPVGSVTAGVVSKDQLACTTSYGDADMEKHTPADQGTVYRIGSVTKMFTVLMLEQLTEAGIVSLSDPVEKYFPEVNSIQHRFPDAAPVTLQQLATHTAGLERDFDDASSKYSTGPASDWEKTLIAALPHTNYKFKPGKLFAYSNIGVAILGATLARAAGHPFTDYVSKQIFEPLGMTHSAFEPTPDLLPHLAKGYVGRHPGIDAGTAQREFEGLGYHVPDGGIYTTVGDLARFVSFLLGEGPESVLEPSSLESDLVVIRTRTLPTFGIGKGGRLLHGSEDSNYGLGVMLVKRKNYTALGHTGAFTIDHVEGYQAALMVNREAGVGVILLANVRGTIDTTDLALRSLDVLSK